MDPTFGVMYIKAPWIFPEKLALSLFDLLTVTFQGQTFFWQFIGGL